MIKENIINLVPEEKLRNFLHDELDLIINTLGLRHGKLNIEFDFVKEETNAHYE